jgi:hypothetical protein
MILNLQATMALPEINADNAAWPCGFRSVRPLLSFC